MPEHKPDTAAIRRLLAAATPWPWRFYDEHYPAGRAIVAPRGPAVVPDAWEVTNADAELIAAAPALLSACCDRIEVLEKAMGKAAWELNHPLTVERVVLQGRIETAHRILAESVLSQADPEIVVAMMEEKDG